MLREPESTTTEHRRQRSHRTSAAKFPRILPLRGAPDRIRRRPSRQRCKPVPHPESRKERTGNPLPTGSSSLLRSEEHTSELQSRSDIVCRLLLEKKKDQ